MSLGSGTRAPPRRSPVVPADEQPAGAPSLHRWRRPRRAAARRTLSGSARPWLAALVGVHFPSFFLPGCGAARVTRNACEPRCFQFLGRPVRGVALLAGAVHDDRIALATSRLLHAGSEI